MRDAGVGGQRARHGFRRLAVAPDARSRLDGAAAAPFVLHVAVVPIDEDRALRGEFDEADAQRLERNLKPLGDSAENAQIDVLVRYPVTQQIAGHQQVAGEVIGFTLDDADGVDAGIDTFLVAVEALLLTAMQDEMTQLVGDGEATALGAGIAVEEDAPLSDIVRVAHQHAFAAIDVERHRGLDLPHVLAIGRGRQHLAQDFQIDGIGHAALTVIRPQPFQDGAGGDGASESLRRAQSSVPAFVLVGEHDLERLSVAILLLVGHPGVLAEEDHVLGAGLRCLLHGRTHHVFHRHAEHLSDLLNPLGRGTLPVLHLQFPDVGLGATDRVGDLLQRQILRLAVASQACSECRSHQFAPVRGCCEQVRQYSHKIPQSTRCATLIDKRKCARRIALVSR